MEITTLQIVLVFIVACIAGMGSILDEFQFHRPLIACTLVGIVLGDMKTGIIIGGTLEMIALGWMNIGAAVAPDAALASIISTILVIAGHQSIGAGIALAIPLAAAGQVLTIIVRTITVAFQHAADKAADNGNLTAISWIHVSSLFLQAMRVAIHTQIWQAMRVLIHTHISCRLLVEGSAPKPLEHRISFCGCAFCERFQRVRQSAVPFKMPWNKSFPPYCLMAAVKHSSPR